MTLRVAIIEHAPYEGPGMILHWIRDRGYTYQIYRPYKAEILPETTEFEILIILGGPQSPLELDVYPYLNHEINLAQKAMAVGKYVLGFCLGAQIIAEALGAKTNRSESCEYGVFPIVLTAEAHQHRLFRHFPLAFNSFHWHNDMPGIPEDAFNIGRSEGCSCQGFVYNDRTVGFQFHLEVEKEDLEAIYKASDIPTDKKFVQSLEETYSKYTDEMAKLMSGFLNTFVQ